MSNAVFPTLPGLTWDCPKTPEFSTTEVISQDGSRTAIANWVYPIWHWALKYELLRDDATDELNTLLGFFLNRQGKADSFLFDDPNDNTRTGQGLGVGDGITTQFQVVRTLGGFVEPVKNLKTMPTVYVSGVEQETGWSISDSGLITFVSAPTGTVTADITYYWRVHFDMDSAEFNQFADALWELQECKLSSERRQ